jgi:hypothetical protein
MYLTISDPSSARYFALYEVADELAVAGAFGAEIWYFVAVPSSALSDMAGPDHCSPRGNPVTTHRRISRLIRPVA